MQTKHLLYLVLVPLLCLSCKQNRIFEDYQDIDKESWCRHDLVEFKTTIPDSGRYIINVYVRHTSDYEMANLWCFVSTRSAAPQDLRDTLNIKVAEPDGRWLGDGSTVKTIQQPLRHNPVTLPKGPIIFRIEQGMRVECLQGIKNIGLEIVKATN